MDEVINECFICGSQIHAGKYPPVCDPEHSGCLAELEINIAYNKMCRDNIKELPE